jgi:hypothetical protein
MLDVSSLFIPLNWRLICQYQNVVKPLDVFSFSPTSGSSLPLTFCIHVCSGPIYWGVIYLAKKIIRWWYFTCKKPKIIICDDILHVNMFHYFKIPYFTCTFLQNLSTMNILDHVFIARCSTIFASELPESPTQSYTLFHHEIFIGSRLCVSPKVC